MKGWQIFLHSVRQVFGNLDAALRVSGLLYLIQVAAQVVFIGTIMSMPDADRRAMMAAGEFPYFGFLIFFLVALVTGLWIAVGWHRYVLTEEQPALLPPFHADRMLGYLGKGILVGLILIIPIVIMGLLMAFLGSGMMMRGQMFGLMILTLILYIPVGIIAMRLSTMLPGVSLRAGVPVMSGWAATTGETMTFLVLVIASGVLLSIPQIIGTWLFGFAGIGRFVWDTLVNWPILMIGISILTTLYGHYIEKRPLV